MYFITIILAFYFIFNISLIFIWLKNKSFPSSKTTDFEKNEVMISVIIPVRNEGKNIRFLLEDLEKQSLSKGLFEVIVADDDSTDDTVLIIEEFQKNTALSLIINQLQDIERNASPKKRAINSSIKLAKGKLITTTDGDCRVGEKWLETIFHFYHQKQPYLISAPVTFLNTGFSISQQAQIIEFASLVGSGACAMLIQQPNMCNGANLTYLKSVFYEVDGFVGNENLASGDDEFLMHKIARKYPEKVMFLKSSDAIVSTDAHRSWQSFYNQRKRWASKWKHYNNWKISGLAVFIFLSNFSWLWAIGLWLFTSVSFPQFLFVSFLKFSAEFMFLSLILRFLKKNTSIFFIPFVQIIYPIYVTFFGLISQGRSEYVWKGRKLR